MQSLQSSKMQFGLIVIFLLFYSFVDASVVANRDEKPYTPPVPKSANRTLYKALYQKPSNSTPRFLNLTHHEVNPQRLAAAGEHSNSPRSLDLLKRQSGPSGTGTCAPGDFKHGFLTRSAFSDMASSAGNRAKFISSLMAFMRNHGFDGVDLDWEYPAADDRGGKQGDTANYVLLVKEMKAAFSRKYGKAGLSVTLPASYWYLQHFDVKSMQPHVDWFNVMSYDIHGSWPLLRHSGVYGTHRTSFLGLTYGESLRKLSLRELTCRPHTNLTEIDDGLSLLWRAGVSASNVVMGLGFYGRSFKLSSPSCNKPGCTFSSGASAGACTGASGILSLAEIGRAIDKYGLTPSYDAKAAVKWITFNTDQ
ncbi:MAG: hypothetical protein L6R40_006630 [Gallowayella cf. fulva]|nr:MAG: hypothetical protein L6R40_006630 [Xanthomendoza cf. fulva]